MSGTTRGGLLASTAWALRRQAAIVAKCSKPRDPVAWPDFCLITGICPVHIARVDQTRIQPMSSIPRFASRARAHASSSKVPINRSPIIRRRPISVPMILNDLAPPTHQHRFFVASSRCVEARRRYATAAAVREVEELEEEQEEEQEEVWPERVLPELSGSDRKRLKRQRNVGM